MDSVPASLVQLTPPRLFLPSPAPILGLSWVLPRPLPKLQICSSHSRWLRVGRDEEAAPTPSGLSQKRRCLMMHFTDGQGLGGKPRCSCAPASRAAGRPHSDRRPPAPPARPGLLHICAFFSWSLFPGEKKRRFSRLTPACLGVQVGVWGPLPSRKEREGDRQPPAFVSTHCAISSCPTPFLF